MLEARIAGIPCLIDPTYVNVVKGQGPSADSDWDCYGYSEVEFEVYDRKGYKANWLRGKMTAADQADIETLILEGATH